MRKSILIGFFVVLISAFGGVHPQSTFGGIIHEVKDGKVLMEHEGNLFEVPVNAILKKVPLKEGCYVDAYLNKKKQPKLVQIGVGQKSKKKEIFESLPNSKKRK